MKYPRIKYEHRPKRLDNGRIRIGGIVFGLASEIDDPEGSVWALLNEMDGSKTVAEIATRLEARGIADSLSVTSALETLADAGYVEDADPDLPHALLDEERDRYSRSRAYYSWIDKTPRASHWHAQERLKDASVVIVGLGGTGGATAAALAMSGIGRLHCVEPDTVDLSNLNRQILYRESDVGLNKAAAAAGFLKARNSGISISTQNQEVRGPKDIEELVTGHDLLVLAADRPDEIRYWANEACLATGVPWVHGGYHGPQVTVGFFMPGNGPCYACVQDAQAEQRADIRVVEEWAPANGQQRVNAANAVSAMVSGGILAHLAISHLISAPLVKSSRVYVYNMMVLDHAFTLAATEERRCETCSPSEPDTRS